jgi:hypothetical protein
LEIGDKIHKIRTNGEQEAKFIVNVAPEEEQGDCVSDACVLGFRE